MKNILFCLILLPFWASSQTEKGASPLAQSSISHPKSSTTRAVVIGISDYQDEAIPDLQYAHRDAEAFAAWLSSPAGGALPATSVKTLLNEQATTGKIIAALDGLISAGKAGDVAIIYFSGHGDVERVTKFQRGYWLTWDSPPTVYAAGAFSLVFLQDIITTLADAGVQVVVVSDACRAGKLAGSEYGGAQATTAALSKQFANEIKILSCQPNEFSLEGEQWGGGRGAFSYHLLDALYGMADQDADERITVKELNRYLEDHVAAETAPHRQNPLVLGDREMRLAAVIPEALAQWRQQKTGEALAFKKIDPRGFEDLLLAGADSSIQALYEAFTLALERGNLMPTDSTADKSANDYYELLIKEPSLADLHGLMTRNFAAALIEEGQQILNRLIKGDAKAWEILEHEIGISYHQIAAKFHRAAGLLGEKHYYYKRLKANAIYFETYTLYNLDIPFDSLRALDLKGTRQAQILDPLAPHMLLNLTYLLPLDSIDYYIEQLEELSPKWADWHYMVANTYWQNGRFDKAIQYYQNAIRLDSTHMAALIELSRLHEDLGMVEESATYRASGIRMALAKAGKEPAALASDEWHNLATALYKQRRYRDAEWALMQDEIYSPKVYSQYAISWDIYSDMGKYDKALKSATRWISRITRTKMRYRLGNIFFVTGDWGNAEKSFKSVTLDSLGHKRYFDLCRLRLVMLYKKTGNFTQARIVLNTVEKKQGGYFFELAEIQRLQGKNQEANSSFDSLLYKLKISFEKNNDSTSVNYRHQIIALSRLGKTAEMQQAIETADQALNGDPWHHFWMACAYAQIGQPEESLRQLDLAETAGWHPNPILRIYGTVKDPFLDPLRHLPEFQAWEKRWSPPYKDYSKE